MALSSSSHTMPFIIAFLSESVKSSCSPNKAAPHKLLLAHHFILTGGTFHEGKTMLQAMLSAAPSTGA